MNKMVEDKRSFKISNFINEQAYGGIILIVITIIALVWANSSYHESYHHLWHELKVGITWGKLNIISSLHHWVNDGLMAIFFFVVGLEIKREVMGGELSSIKKAALPITAAIGGMVIPAILYAVVTINYPELKNGWGVPMATDIAFALGLLAILGDRVNINLKIFLTALAIADDLGAVLVIAIFYTESIDFHELITAGFFLSVMTFANYLGVRRATFYGFVGFIGVWIAFLFSGVHATVAGVLIALTIPARTEITQKEYVNKIKMYISKFSLAKSNTSSTLLSKDQAHIIDEIEDINDSAHTPLQRLEHALHPISAYFILPIFALSNAGIHVEGDILDLLLHPVALGIIVGLIAGKFFGITLFSKLAIKLKLAELPKGVQWKELYGVAFLAGIGFTMSIFISELAFVNEEYKLVSKVGIMAASVLSGIIGMVWLIQATKDKKA